MTNVVDRSIIQSNKSIHKYIYYLALCQNDIFAVFLSRCKVLTTEFSVIAGLRGKRPSYNVFGENDIDDQNYFSISI